MEIRSISLLSGLAASAILLGWLIQQLRAIYVLGHTWLFQHKIGGRIEALKPPDKTDRRVAILLGGIGILVGAIVAYELSKVLIREWLLLGIVILFLLSEELQPETHEKELLAVLVLIDRFRAHCMVNKDIFEILAAAVQELPEGEVQRRVRESIFMRRKGEPFAKCLAEMAGIDPFLDEFILNLQLVDGSASGPAIALILDRLQDRVGKKWDDTSRLVLLINKTLLPVLFGRSVLIAGGWVVLITSPYEWIPAFLSRLSLFWLGGIGLGLGFLIYLVQTQKWVRRVMVVLIAVISLAFNGNTFSVPNLTNIPILLGSSLETVRIGMDSSAVSPAPANATGSNQGGADNPVQTKPFLTNSDPFVVLTHSVILLDSIQPKAFILERTIL